MIDTPGPAPIPVSGDQLGSAYDRLREQGTVVPVRLPDGSDAWLVTGHRAVSRALADPLLSLDRRHARGGWSGFALPPALDANLLNMDPPDHTRIRRLVSSAFTPQRVEALRPDIRRIADELLDVLVGPTADAPTRPATDTPAGPAGAGRAELIEDYCAPLAVRVISHLLGVPDADQADFRAWTRTMLATHPPDRAAVGQAIVEMHGFIIELLRAKRRQPADDLLSALVSGPEEDQLSGDELTSLAFLILFAGYENSVNLLGNTLLALLYGGTGLAGLATDPLRVATVIEETLRREPPAPVAIRRFPIRDLVIDGTAIPAGSTVLLALTAANRDPAHREDANLAFGRGIHYCVGAPLARAEVAEAIMVLAGRLPGLCPARPAAELPWRPSFRSHGPAQLPVSW
jgi:cytochrome P450